MRLHLIAMEKLMTRILAAVGLAALLAGAPVLAFAEDAAPTPTPTPMATDMPMKAKPKMHKHKKPKKMKMAPTPMATPDAPKS